MSYQPRAFNRPQSFDSDSGGDDEAFPPTRFFTDALAHNVAPLKKRKRNVTIVIVAGFGLGCIALAGLAALLIAQ